MDGMGSSLVALGVMSGTSADGADAVAIELDPSSRSSVRVLDHAHEPFSDDVARALVDPSQLSADAISDLHFLLPEFYAATAKRLAGFDRAAVCGCHGQTLVHQPPSKGAARSHSLQIGSSAVLAARLGLPIVGDVRGADLALGGEGAPLVPMAHWFFADAHRLPQVVVNLGGIANFTWVTEDVQSVISYDVGPGMMLSDAWATRCSGGEFRYDRDGESSSRGRIVDEVIDAVTAHPFVSQTPPRSTGREDFGRSFYGPLFEAWADHEESDVARSLVEATAAALTITLHSDSRVVDPRAVVLTGGGAKNPTLVRAIEERLAPWPVEVAEEGPLSPQIHEPAAMAWIAARTLHRLPSSLPSVTGAARAAVLGHVHYPP